MRLNGYEMDFLSVFKQLKKLKARRVLLQVPEGLKHKAFHISSVIEDEMELRCFVQVDPCFGSCDLMSNDVMDQLGIDAVIQIGHLPIPSMDQKDGFIPYFFVNALSTHEITTIIEKAMDVLEGRRIGLVTTAQHITALDEVVIQLKKNGFEPILSAGDDRIYAEGQVLGCNFSVGTSIADEVDSFLFIGSGFFHPLGLLLSVNKPVIIADPYLQQVKKEELVEIKDSVLRQRYGAIAHAKTAQRFGILVGLKEGQQRMKQAENISVMLKKKGKTAFLLTVNHISPSFLEGFPSIDCFVSTLCPRIAIDDYVQYKTPLITPIELEISLGLRSWETYTFDEIKN